MRKFFRWALWSAVMGLGGWVVLKLLRTTAQNTEAVSLPSARAAVENVVKDVTDASSSSRLAPTPNKGRVNLNKASQDELADLRGVGPVLAGRIVAARPFKSVADLTKVSGIGKAKLNELKGTVTL